MYVKVKVVPKAKKEMVKKVDESTYEMSVKEPAERNLANGRIRELLALEYGVMIGKVRMVTGHRSGSKIFDVEL